MRSGQLRRTRCGGDGVEPAHPGETAIYVSGRRAGSGSERSRISKGANSRPVVKSAPAAVRALWQSPSPSDVDEDDEDDDDEEEDGYDEDDHDFDLEA
jgi:hypothetical protein